MKKIELNLDGKQHNFEIANCWEDVTVLQFSKIYSKDENKTDYEHLVDMVTILSNIPKDVIMEMTTQQFQLLVEEIQFIKTEIKYEEKEVITINKEDYYFKSDYNQLTVGEDISLKIIMEEQNEGKTIYSLLPKMLCVFLRKKIDGKLEKFNESFMNRESLFNKVKIIDVNNQFTFFLNGLKQSD